MSSVSELMVEVEALKATLARRDAEILALRQRLGEGGHGFDQSGTTTATSTSITSTPEKPELVKEDIERYSRQIILPELRVAGQRKLKGSSALVVGCGGLGCPAAAYLAAAGVGRLGLADHDSVDLSNLHRQVLHTQARIGEPKALSLAASLAALNPSIQLVPHRLALTSANALDIIGQYDVILDCTDNVATRYLLNDACLLAGRPLVSGSALRWEGQLTVYNWEGAGPTYRCLYPRPPPAAAVTNCSEGGVVGAVPGVIGCLQALETVKMLSGLQPSYSGSLLLFDGLEGRARVVKLRPRREGAEAAVTELIDYEQFCGAAAGDGPQAGVEVVGPEDRVGPRHLAEVRAGAAPHLLVDLRPEVEQEMCGLPGSLSLPLPDLQRGGQAVAELLQGGRLPLYLICRRGNDSQEGVLAVRALLPAATVRDVRGGLHAWAAQVDPGFPVY